MATPASPKPQSNVRSSAQGAAAPSPESQTQPQRSVVCGSVSESLTPEAIRAQLEKILASPGLVNSTQLCRFLRYAVDRTLAGDPGSLKENLLGADVFERGAR